MTSFTGTSEFIGSSSLDSDEATIAAARDAGMARIEERQAQSARFIVENGAAVVDGHEPVGVPLPQNLTPMTGDVYDPAAD